MTTVRPEQAEDVAAVRQVNEQAFETPAEARLVDLLRGRGKLIVSLVAHVNDHVVGHIAFSPVHLDSSPSLRGLGLGPMAVLPDMQNKGIGSLLVQAGLEHCRALACDYVVLVGHPEYYPRFGFVPARRFGLSTTWELPEGVFMTLELKPRVLDGSGGLVTYEPEFNDV